MTNVVTMLLELKMSQAQQQQQQQQHQASTGLLYNAAGQPVAISLPAQTSGYEFYKSRQSKIVGIILIIVGVLSIVLNGIGIGLSEIGTYSGYAFGPGILVSIFCILD